ncbi:PepSY domain-containing protein [Croceibacterium sp. LX-88]|uniref:PepSY domain-containing protein n=1 Tax=Croceibacterium selenioxidans TaxID=2838833 RepID=A0ABS5W071_9SPHN|nr:PepSY domain-containing protein [Croceibacterium selenioxidans]MBT2133039.1 PepSY domain-containing protein [Croceibacterium selenioxidans]
MSTAPRYERWYLAVWRWHFYAGLFCVPFILWLSVTGGIYLFKPQIESLLYAPYRGVVVESGPLLTPARIVEAGTAAVPGSVLHKYVLPEDPADAVQLLVGAGERETRVWVHPQSGEVLHKVAEEDRLMRVVFRLHGELLAGKWGSALVEIAACWTIVMILTGLFLWWPRGGAGLAGVVWPRLRRGKRVFWRDIHAVTGLWVSIGAVFLIASGLPWATNWSAYLREVRAVTGTSALKQDWSSGSEADAAARAQLDMGARAMLDEHAGHHGVTMVHEKPTDRALNHVIPQAAELGLAAPVEISPPTAPNGYWLAQSQAANRPERGEAELDDSGALIGRQTFDQRHWIDRVVGYGVAVHEGAWLGLANQLLNLAILLGLVTLALSSVVLWWRRRPAGKLGTPPASAPLRHSWALVGATVGLALLMPLFGLTLALVAFAGRVLPRVAPGAANWAGIRR